MPEGSGIVSILDLAMDGDKLIVLGQIDLYQFGIYIYDLKTDQCHFFAKDSLNQLALDRNSHTVWALSTVLSWLEWVSFDSRTGNELANWGDGNFEDFNMSANNFWFDGLNLTASTFVSVSSRDYQNLQVYKKFRIELPEGLTKLSEGSFIDGIPDGYKVISVISGGSNGGIEAAVLQNKETNAVSTLIRYDERTVMINVFADRAVRCGDRILLFTKDTRFVFLLDPQSF